MTEQVPTPTPWYLRQAGETSRFGDPYDWIADSPERGQHRKIIVSRDGASPADMALIVEAVNSYASLKARIQVLEELSQFLCDRLEEFDPGDDEPEREYHGHVAPAAARLRDALQPQDKANG